MGCGRIPLVENVALPDDFVTGIDHIEMVGNSCARFILYCDHTPLDGSPPHREMVRPVVIPLDCLPKAVRKALRFMAERGVDLGKEKLSKLVS